jgi:hypothetical protein
VIEEFPQPGPDGSPGFAGATAILSTGDLWKRFLAGEARVHDRALLRARLFDLWIEDWDRHNRQWRWLQRGEGAPFEPLPEDRDQAFSRFGGLLLSIARATHPKLMDFEWGNVAQVTAPEFFEVEDMGGGLYFGSLRPGRIPDVLEVVADWGENAVPLRRVARIQLVESGFRDRFRGSIDAGASYTSASELLQLDLDGDLSYRRPRFEASARANAVVTQQPDVDDTRRSSLTLAYARLFPNRHRIFAQGTLEQNEELGFDLRSSRPA